MSKQIPWLRISAEGVVIVGSILLAFVIDAWWDQAQLTEEVGQDLANVAEELEGNLDWVLFDLEVMDRMVAGGTAMAEVMELESVSSSVSLPDTLVWLGTSAGVTLNASLGALDALIASGRLALVDDPRVRLNLGGLRSQVDDLVENQRRVVALTDTQLRPLSFDRFSNVPVLAVATAFYTEGPTLGRELTHRSHVTYPNSPSLRNLIRLRTAILITTIPKGELLRTQLEELRGVLR